MGARNVHASMLGGSSEWFFKRCVIMSTRSQCVCSASTPATVTPSALVKNIYCGALSVVTCCTSDAALGGPFLAKRRYHIARGHRKTACSPVWDLFVRLQKPLLNDDYAARRSICAFSAVGGCGRYVRTAWCCDGLTSATPSVDFSTPRSLCCSGGGGLQTTRPNFRVAVLLKYRSNAHDVVEGTYADDPGPIGSLRKLLGGR